MKIEELYDLYLKCGGAVSTDSRSVAPGQLFIALKGENFDGNVYACSALERGAAYAVVNEDSEAAGCRDDRIIAVRDTFETLKDLARHHRRNCLGDRHLPVIGLTGTNGKTTTKELIAAVLSSKYRVSYTKGNLNNDIGVPLTLLSIKDDTEIAVVEMGANHPDDISHLVNVCEPDFGLITNVGKAHLLGFGSFEGVKRAKGQLYDYIAAHGGELFVNVDDPVLAEMACSRGSVRRFEYGPEYDDAEIIPGQYLAVKVDGQSIETSLVGTYNAVNVLAALAVGRRFGIEFAFAKKAISSYLPSNNRSQLLQTARNCVIMDMYNANPSSVSAALDNFAEFKQTDRIACLGDMRELGENSRKEHLAVIERLESIGCKYYLVGSEFEAAAALAGSTAGLLGCYKDSAQLCRYLTSHPVSGACILVKGSRGIMMEKIIPAL